MRVWKHQQLSVVLICCALSARVLPVSAAQQATFNAWRPHFSALGRLNWKSQRSLLQNGTSGDSSSTLTSPATAAPASSPTILQAADVTFRLIGSDAFPFSNTTAKVFQQALQNVFSNFSYAGFQYESFMVMIPNTTATVQLTHKFGLCWKEAKYPENWLSASTMF